MIQQIASGQDHTALPYLAPNAMIYTDQVLTCASCEEKYECGFLVEIRGMGLYCFPCFRPAFVEYFDKHPKDEFLFARGVWTLAGRNVTTKRSELD